MLDPNSYSVIGLYLTLAGLLGTFFYVHLSGWLQDLLKLHSKWDINKLATDEGQKSALRECRFELKGLFNHVPFTAAFIVSMFIFVLSKDAVELLSQAPNDMLANRLGNMLTWFLWFYYILTGYLLLHGIFLGFKIRSGLKPKTEVKQ
jgi:hypothetical protein